MKYNQNSFLKFAQVKKLKRIWRQSLYKRLQIVKKLKIKTRDYDSYSN